MLWILVHVLLIVASPHLCPLWGSCLVSNVVYRANLKVDNGSDKFYIGSSVEFKSRYRAHMNSFSNERYCNSTVLASYIHSHKKVKRKFSVEWTILARITSFRMDTSSCCLCILESLRILQNLNSRILNRFTDASKFLNMYKSRFK